VHAWPAPEIPDLPGTGLPLRLHDSATGQVRPTAPGPIARMYVCGITPYDATHIGHAATYVTFDLVHRAWLDAGHDVHYVQNVTDVDDPLLERAERDGEDWASLADRETTLFREDMTSLGVVPPRHYVGAVESIPDVVVAVRTLREQGAAYDVDGDTYFSVHSDPRFGGVGNLDDETMVALFAERGGDPERPGKKHPLDCLLWQSARPGEPSWATGDPELPDGRPGWHVECAAIALRYLGDGFDVQGGGRDLVFPHHEMSASEGQVLTGCWPFARHYVHGGLVGLDGEKMSKSQGNLVFVSVLRRDGHDPMAVRLALLAHHYRGDWSWTADDLVSAETRLGRWRDAVSRPGRPPTACWPRCAGTWPTTWTLPRRWRPSTAGPRMPSPAADPTGPPPTWSAGPPTPSSAYASDQDRLRHPGG
jgi:L-cysteine:1D-myo-inositol 2-amino-2-deoxy-alpha-D-glucopyranoside ligase